MKTTTAILFSLFLITALLAKESLMKTILKGTERWDVKTLSDSSVSKINFSPISLKISGMRMLNTKKIGNYTARFSSEFSTYTIQCKVREFRKEDDGDYHLVLMDLADTNLTIIGEIPDTFQVRNKFKASFAQARDFFDKSMKMPNHKVHSGIYQITGVCFFDKIHGQLGVAPNGVEIHPILSITKK